MPLNENKTEIVEVNDVSCGYNDILVLENVSLKIYAGDYLGIVGPNGGGKTTLLKTILGLIKPVKGTVRLFGQDISIFSSWHKIGYVPQKVTNFDQSFPLTVEEIVKLAKISPVPENGAKTVDEYLEMVGMESYKKNLIGSLSGGQQQRVFIAKALASRPQIMFLDEPTVGIDQRTQEQFYEILKHLNKNIKITIVMISHDIDVIASEANRIACVNKYLISNNNPKKFLRNNKLSNFYGKGVRFVFHDHEHA